MKITAVITWQKCKVYFNDTLHLWFLKDEVLGIQSWVQGPLNYAIEITFKNGTTMLAEYNDHFKFTEVLKLLDENLEKN